MQFLFRRLVVTLGAIAMLAIGFLLGQSHSEPLAAQQPGTGVVPATGTAPAPAAADRRVVAYVYGNIPVTREEFGDHLIQQYGRDKVRLYVNRKVIEMAAAKRNIVVTPAEIQAIIDDDCKKLGVKKEDFVHTVLKQKYGKTLDEWREDVIKPRLILQAMCRDSIKINEADLKKVYDNLFGEKIQCKIILWQLEERKTAFSRYDTIRKSDKDFDEAARTQVHSDLAARGGLVDPIGRNSGPGTAKIEELAFNLKDGQLSELIETPGGIMVIKRVGSIPAKTDVSFEAVKPALIKEFTDRQMEIEIPKMFAAINEEAKPLFILAPMNETTQERDARSRLLGVDPSKLEKK